jgi:tight adherence protein B
MPSFWVFLAWGAATALLLPSLVQALSKRLLSVESLLAKRLEDFHIFVRPRALRAVLLATLALSIAAAIFVFQSMLALPFIFFAAVFGIFGLFRMKLAKRFKAIRYQLPGVIELVGTSLRAGLSIRAALLQVSRQSANPIAQELAVLERMQRIGIPLTGALAEWAKRIPLEDVRLLGFTVGVSSSSGGNLADALDRLANACRQRLIVEEKVDALSAQGRLQAWVMVALPILLAIALSLIDMSSMRPLWTTGAGHLVIAIVLGLELLGLLWIRRLVAIKD